MSYSTANSQGYMTGGAGFSDPDTCTNDGTTPCTPTSGSDSTVVASANKQTYCTALAGYASEPAIGTDAANACKYGTTDGCAYNANNHTMNCPGQSAVARPTSGAWDAGAYQYNGQGLPPNPPTSLSAVVN